MSSAYGILRKYVCSDFVLCESDVCLREGREWYLVCVCGSINYSAVLFYAYLSIYIYLWLV